MSDEFREAVRESVDAAWSSIQNTGEISFEHFEATVTEQSEFTTQFKQCIGESNGRHMMYDPTVVLSDTTLRIFRGGRSIRDYPLSVAQTAYEVFAESMTEYGYPCEVTVKHQKET